MIEMDVRVCVCLLNRGYMWNKKKLNNFKIIPAILNMLVKNIHELQ